MEIYKFLEYFMKNIKQVASRRTTMLWYIGSGIAMVLAVVYVVNLSRKQSKITPQKNNLNYEENNPNIKQLNQHLIPLQKYQTQYPQYITNIPKQTIRHLEQSNNFWDPNSTKSNIYMILLIVGLSILVVGSIAFCVIFIVRYFRNSNHIHQIKNTNSAFTELDTEIIFPQLDYGLFFRQIGKPLHDSCVICLQTFQPQTSSQPQPQPFPKQQKSTQQQKNQNKVSLTVCGHLLHYKCLAKWIQRQPNCPLCRQQFTDQNLIQWQNKIHIDFSYIYRLLELEDQNIRYNINTRGDGHHLNRCNSRQNSQILKQIHRTRDSTQLNWLKLYNNRTIVNKQRHQKYNINKILNKYPKQKQKKCNKLHISPITNDYSHTPQTMIRSEITHPILNQSLNNNDGTTTNLPVNPHKKKQKLQKQRISTKYKYSTKDQDRNIQNNLQIIKIDQLSPLSYCKLTSQQLYGLVVYAAIMDYHDSRLQQGNQNVRDCREEDIDL